MSVRPIRTPGSNFTYTGPTDDIGDLPCQRVNGMVLSVWELDDAERAAIAAGANIELGIYHEPIPPVSLAVSEQEAPQSAELVRDIRASSRAIPKPDGLTFG